MVHLKVFILFYFTICSSVYYKATKISQTVVVSESNILYCLKVIVSFAYPVHDTTFTAHTYPSISYLGVSGGFFTLGITFDSLNIVLQFLYCNFLCNFHQMLSMFYVDTLLSNATYYVSFYEDFWVQNYEIYSVWWSYGNACIHNDFLPKYGAV